MRERADADIFSLIFSFIMSALSLDSCFLDSQIHRFLHLFSCLFLGYYFYVISMLSLPKNRKEKIVKNLIGRDPLPAQAFLNPSVGP